MRLSKNAARRLIVAELEPTPPLAGDRACRYRAAPAKVMGYRHLPKLRAALISEN